MPLPPLPPPSQQREIIPGEIPGHYLPQVQILMEVFDLDVCDFVQYRPEGAFEREQLVVLEIKRDREWFANALPVMKQFMEDIEAIKAGRLDPPDAHERLGLKRPRSEFAAAPKMPLVFLVDMRAAHEEEDDEEEAGAGTPEAGAVNESDLMWEQALAKLDAEAAAVTGETATEGGPSATDAPATED